MFRRFHTVVNKCIIGQIKEICYTKEGMYPSKRIIIKNIIVENIYTKGCLSIKVLDKDNIKSSDTFQKMLDKTNLLIFYSEEHCFISMEEVVGSDI